MLQILVETLSRYRIFKVSMSISYRLYIKVLKLMTKFSYILFWNKISLRFISYNIENLNLLYNTEDTNSIIISLNFNDNEVYNVEYPAINRLE